MHSFSLIDKFRIYLALQDGKTLLSVVSIFYLFMLFVSLLACTWLLQTQH